MNAKQRQLEERLSKKETEVINFGKVKMMFYSDVNGLINIDFLFKKTIDCLINIWFLFLIEWETQGSCHEITRKNKWARQIDHSLWESHWIFLFLFIWNSSIYCHNFLSSHICWFISILELKKTADDRLVEVKMVRDMLISQQSVIRTKESEIT